MFKSSASWHDMLYSVAVASLRYQSFFESINLYVLDLATKNDECHCEETWDLCQWII